MGLLAENETDCETLKVLISRLAPRRKFGFQFYASKGCSQLRIKAAGWMKDAASKGCRALILLHDLDRDPENGTLNDEVKLRQKLDALAVPKDTHRLLCIPVEELEAWFWCDANVLAKVQGREGKHTSAPKAQLSPDRLRSPKEALEKLSRDGQRKPRYTTLDNPKLAEWLDLDLCAERCPSFRELQQFVEKRLTPSG